MDEDKDIEREDRHRNKRQEQTHNRQLGRHIDRETDRYRETDKRDRETKRYSDKKSERQVLQKSHLLDHRLLS
jgi:hypothetical protein